MGRRLKISNKVIAIMAAVLIVIVVITALIYRSGMDKNSEGLTIVVGDKEQAHYTLEQIMSMESCTEYKKIKSGSSKTEKGDYTGVMVNVLLKNSKIDSNIKNIIFISEDGYSSAAEYEEIDDIMIAYEKDGGLLEDFDKGGSGPLRCIMLNDEFGTRGIKNIVKIKCVKSE